MKKILIYDIDGVVANSQNRYRRNAGDGDLSYNEFRKAMVSYALDVYDDTPIQVGIELIDQIRRTHNIDRMVAVTARGEEGRSETLKWLQKHMPWDVFDEDLYMRPAYIQYEPGIYWRDGEEKFDSVEYKKNVALELMKNFEVVMAFDDHHDISHGYWEIGIPSICLMIPGVDQGTRMQAAISNLIQG